MVKNKFTNRLIASVLIAAMISQMFTGFGRLSTSYAVEKQEEKMPNWAVEAITFLQSENVLIGDENGDFRPNDPITRAEFITVITRVMGVDSVVYDDTFSDVDKDDWYANNIATAEKYGFIKGYEDGSVKPNEYISRVEMTAVLARILGLEENVDFEFSDIESIPKWGKGYVGAIVKAGYVKGYVDGSFRASNNIIRAETAVVLKRSFEDVQSRKAFYEGLDIGNKTKIESEDSSSSRRGGSSSGGSGGSSSAGSGGNVVPVIPVITTLSERNAPGGDLITINGTGFSANKDQLIVTFDGEIQSDMIASIVESSDTRIKVIVPGLIGENTKVEVKARNNPSNKVDFTIDNVLDPTANDHGNEAREVIEVVDEVVEKTLHELQIGLIPFLISNGLNDEATEIEKQLTDLDAYTTTNLSSVLTNLSDEDLSRMDAIFGSESMQEQLTQLKSTAEILSHSSTGEAIDNINQAIEALEETIDVLKEIRFWVKATLHTLQAASLAATIFDFGATASTLAPVIEVLEIVLDDVIEPIIGMLEIVYELLNVAPTDAVGGSFATQNYSDSLGINQYFGSMESPIKENPGTIYINQPYYFEGSIDYTSEDSARNWEYMKTIIFDSVLARILDSVGAIPDLDIEVSGVEVKLGVISSNPDVISGEWISSNPIAVLGGENVVNDDKLKITAHKIGEATLTIYADIAQMGDEIAMEDLSITRTFKAISGNETQAPFTMGAKIDTVTNTTIEDTNNDLTAYIGDTLEFKGEGFSKKRKMQKTYFESVAGYNNTGLSINRNLEYTNFDVEVPDTVTGKLNVTVGNWPSDDIDISILPPNLTRVVSSAIIGESWPVKGEGFSHTLAHNEANYNGFKVLPFKSAGVHPDHHKTLSFMVPPNANSGDFSITTIGELVSNKIDVAVKGFTDETMISNANDDALRPAVAYDEVTGNKIVVYIDKNDKNDNQLLATIEDNNVFGDAKVISDHIGGLNVAPSIPSVTATKGMYFVSWAENVNGIDRIYFSYSSDGTTWSNKMAVSNAAITSHSYESDIEASDIDNDGDVDVLISWTQEGKTTNDNATIKLAVLENDSNTSFSINDRYDITRSSQDSNDSDIAVYDDFIAIAYSKDYGTTVDEYKRDIYVQRMTPSGLRLTQGTTVNISKNEGGYLPEKYDKQYYINEAEDIFRIAENPSIDIDDNNNVYVAYENTLETFKEDIFYAKLLANNEIVEPTNISHSDLHSQSPQVNLDGDRVSSITYMEQGFATAMGFNNERDDSFVSSIIFARSFDDGETFNEPYMQLHSDDTGNRIGHLNMDTSGRGEIAIVWQSDEGDYSHINMRTTSGDITAPTSYPANNAVASTGNYIIRTQSNTAFLEDFLPDPKTWVQGDLYITNMDGTGVRRITRKASIYGRASANLVIEKISYVNNWLSASELDGSHPMGLWKNDYPFGAYYSNDGAFIAFSAEGEMYDPNEGGSGYITSDGMQVAAADFGDLGTNPWTNNGGLLFSTIGAYGDIDAMGIIYPSYSNKIYLDEDEESEGATISPGGKLIAYTKGTTKRDGNNPKFDNYGDLYVMDILGEHVQKIPTVSNAMTPVFSNDGKKIAYVYDNSGNQDICVVELDSPYVVTNITDTSYADEMLPEFSFDDQKIVHLEGISDKLSIVQTTVSTHQKSYLGQLTGSTGRPDLFSTKPENIVIEYIYDENSENHINENQVKKVKVSLSSKPAGDVTIDVSIGNGASIDVSQVIFNSANWHVAQEITITPDNNNTEDDSRFLNLLFTMNSLTQDEQYKDVVAPSIWFVIDDDEGADSVKPVWVNGSLTTSDLTSTSLKLTWVSAADNRVIASYNIYKDDILIQNVDASVNDYDFTGLLPNTEYTLKIEAIDTSDNKSSQDIKISLGDVDSPKWDLADVITTRDIGIDNLWILFPEASDNIGVANYKIYQDDILVSTATANGYNATNLIPNTSYAFKVYAVDASNNVSVSPLTITVQTLADTEVPVWNPNSFSVTEVTAAAIKFSWVAALDNYKVKSYKIYIDDVLKTTVDWDVLTYTLDNLDDYTAYKFDIVAEDYAGNLSLNQTAITVNTIGSKFVQGTGYNDGLYQQDDIHPTTFNWDRHSRFAGATTNVGMKWKVGTSNSYRNKEHPTISPVITSDGKIMAVLGDKLNTVDRDGNVLYTSYLSYNNSPLILTKEAPLVIASGKYLKGYDINDTSLYEMWSNQALDDQNMTMKSSPAVTSTGDIVYSMQQHLFGINPGNVPGNPISYSEWSMNIGRGFDYMYSSPAIGSDGTVYIGRVENAINAINSDGSYKWHFPTSGSVESSPAIGTDGTIYVGSDDNNVYALNSNSSKKWEFTTGDKVRSSAAIGADGTIYIGSNDKKLYAINPDGTQKWAFTATSSVIASPIVDKNNVVYFADSNGSVYALGGNDGIKRWSFKLSTGVTSSLVIGDDGTIYALTVDGILYALGEGDRGSRFGFENTSYTVAEDGGTLEIAITRDDVRTEETIIYGINLSDSANTATSSDCTNTDGELTFAIGESKKTFSINIVKNIHFYGDKIAVLEIKDITQFATTRAEITITDATTASIIDFESESLSIDEDGGSLSIKLIREGNTTTPASINVRLNPDPTQTTATEKTDYTFSGLGAITFGRGETEKIITLNLVNDTDIEGNEKITLYLEKDIGDTTVAIKTLDGLEISIVDDESLALPIITVSINNGLGEITVSNIISGAKLTLHYSAWSGGISGYLYDVTTATAIFERVTEGTDYYVTQNVNGTESGNSNKVDVVVPKVTSLLGGTSIQLSPGTDQGTTKVSIINVGSYTYYCSGYNSGSISYPAVGSNINSLGTMSEEITGGIRDNVGIMEDDYMYVYQLDTSGIIVGFESVKATASDIKPWQN